MSKCKSRCNNWNKINPRAEWTSEFATFRDSVIKDHDETSLSIEYPGDTEYIFEKGNESNLDYFERKVYSYCPWPKLPAQHWLLSQHVLLAPVHSCFNSI